MSSTKWILLGVKHPLTLCGCRMDLAVIGLYTVQVVLLYGLGGDQ